MNPEQWHKAKELIAEALLQPTSQREAFLVDCCSDAALRTEVSSLLRHNPDVDLSCPHEHHQLARRVFCEALDLPAAHRGAFLDRQCLTSPTLRRVVSAMLDSTTVIGPYGSRTAADPRPSRHHPQQIATYRIVRHIGTGGMGTVFEAIQAQPERRVALKLIRGDKISPELMRRFGVEIEALGRLRHPGIARIYEGGTFDGPFGPQPYFVMEIVEGLPLDVYVVAKRIGLRDALRLLIKVSAAVHHAHEQDVIHRDLKPANILVDDAGQPKILDFGVARVIGIEPPTGEAIARTQPGVLMGTLPYMSPEQFEADPDHFDQRSDVYALGVIAYKILSGRLPYRFAGGFIEAANVIHEAPLQRLGDVDHRIRGDLEVVLRKALAKERAKRYLSASAFGNDLSCVLLGQPISVSPSTFGTVIRRWAMREENIRQVGWAGVIGYALLSFFFFFYLCGGLLSLVRPLPVLPRDIDYRSFMGNLVAWTIGLAVLSRVSWHVAQGRLVWMWIAFVSALGLAGFTTSVLLGLLKYKFGGALNDPVLRTALYMMYTPLAFLELILLSLALFTAYRLRQWDRPVVAPAEK